MSNHTDMRPKSSHQLAEDGQAIVDVRVAPVAIVRVSGRDAIRRVRRNPSRVFRIVIEDEEIRMLPQLPHLKIEAPEGEIERSRRREDEEVIEPIPLIVDGVDQEISSPFSASSLGIHLGAPKERPRHREEVFEPIHRVGHAIPRGHGAHGEAAEDAVAARRNDVLVVRAFQVRVVSGLELGNQVAQFIP